MNQNLSITINGLEYVAKAATQSIKLEQKDILINYLQAAVSALEEKNKEKDNIIKCLEEAVSELEEENNENDSIINELRSTLDDIELVISRTN